MRHEALPRVLRRALGLMRFARSKVGAQSASLFLVDHDAKRLRGVLSEWDWTRTSFVAELASWPTVTAILADGQSRTISKREALGGEALWFERHGITSTVCVPLSSTTGAFGVIFFDFEAEIAPTADLPFLTDVGRRCARALTREPIRLDDHELLHSS